MPLAILFMLAAAPSATAAQRPPQEPVTSPPPVSTPAPPPPVERPGGVRGRTRGATPAIRANARPASPLQSLINIADYPASALREREQGRPRFRLTVGADGRVTGCIILVSSGSTALDSATCRIMRSRARFNPALDGNGRPVEDQYWGEIAWRIVGQ